MTLRRLARDLTDALPIAPGVMQRIRPNNPPVLGNYRLDRLEDELPRWIEAARQARDQAHADWPRSILLFAWLPWWLEYGVALSLLLAGQGHEVHLAYVSDRDWTEESPSPVRGRQGAYVARTLDPVRQLVGVHALRVHSGEVENRELASGLEEQSRRDVQYIRRREELDLSASGEDAGLIQFRRARNRALAASLLKLMTGRAFHSVVIPNGSLLDFGVAYRVARHLRMTTVTYEFGEQRERMWLARDAEVMLQDTSDFWRLRRSDGLSAEELEAMRAMTRARRQGQRWENFGRQWQPGESQGADAVRQALGLDAKRQVAVLCTNVVGDSLALGRQVFTDGMADWLRGTVKYFGSRTDVQLVVRVHPGEALGTGLPSTEIIQETLPQLPGHVVVVPPESPFNTYDVIDLADIGLVYTTTAGLEMAMAGLPVVVAGRTHYRGRGFTFDPESWPAYFETLDRLTNQPVAARRPNEQVELAWRYAYRFFFDYPFPFPWHLIRFWEDEAERPMQMLLRPGGLMPYQPAIDAFAGEPLSWDRPS